MDPCVKTVQLTNGGRLVIPAEFRRALGMKEGDVLRVELRDNDLVIYTAAEGIKRAQAIIRRYVPQSVSLADELIAERRAEAARE